MTLRNRECKVQVQPSRVSARIAALTVVALALALTRYPATPSDDEGRPTATDRTTTSHAADSTQSRKKER